MKKRLTFVAVVLTFAFAAVPAAQASVSNPGKSTVAPNPWKVVGPAVNPNVGAAPNPWKSFRVAPNPWKSVGVDPNPWKDTRVDPNPFKDTAAATWGGKRPNPFLSRGKRLSSLIQIGYRAIR